MSGQARRDPFESGTVEVGPDVAVVVLFDKVQAIGDLGMTLGASVRGRDNIPPALIVAALRQLAGDLERKFVHDGDCVCGENHG